LEIFWKHTKKAAFFNSLKLIKMDSTLIAAIIGGICTIGAVLITPLAQRYFETKGFFPIDQDRRKILEGTWRGIVQQVIDSTYHKYQVDLIIEIKGKKLVGTGIISSNGSLYYVALDGSFRNDRFLKMDYQNKDLNIVQFGCFIFNLSESSKILEGRFVGYGQLTKNIVYGTCEFQKI
jgi:hypothetical protein